MGKAKTVVKVAKKILYSRKGNEPAIKALLEKWKKNPIKTKKTMKSVKATWKAVRSGTLGMSKVMGSKPLKTGIKLFGKKGTRVIGAGLAYGTVAPVVATTAATALIKKKCPKSQLYDKATKRCIDKQI